MTGHHHLTKAHPLGYRPPVASIAPTSQASGTNSLPSIYPMQTLSAPLQQTTTSPNPTSNNEITALIVAVVGLMASLMQMMFNNGSNQTQALATSSSMTNTANGSTLSNGYQQFGNFMAGNGMGQNLSESAAFDKALAPVLKWEGGYVNHPSDPGGETNKGITHATYAAWRKKKGLPAQSVKNITDAEVKAIYKEDYWQASGADKIAVTNPALAMVVFNCAVNMGVGRASDLLKQSGNDYRKFLSLQEGLYRKFAANGQGVFLEGWMNRHRDITQNANTLAGGGGALA